MFGPPRAGRPWIARAGVVPWYVRGGEAPGAQLPSDPDGIWLESLFISQADDTDVATWVDASAAEYDLASDRTHPKFRTNITPSGAPVIRAADSSRLAGTGGFYTDSDEGATFFAVAEGGSVGDYKALFGLRTGTGTQPQFWYRYDSSSEAQLRQGAATPINFGTGLSDGAFRVFSGRFDPGATGVDRMKGWVGLSNVDNQDRSLNASLNALAVFGQVGSNSFAFTGDMTALLWYRSALSDSDHETVVEYLTARYITP